MPMMHLQVTEGEEREEQVDEKMAAHVLVQAQEVAWE
jgi:hypothetical protein